VEIVLNTMCLLLFPLLLLRVRDSWVFIWHTNLLVFSLWTTIFFCVIRFIKQNLVNWIRDDRTYKCTQIWLLKITNGIWNVKYKLYRFLLVFWYHGYILISGCPYQQKLQKILLSFLMVPSFSAWDILDSILNILTMFWFIQYEWKQEKWVHLNVVYCEIKKVLQFFLRLGIFYNINIDIPHFSFSDCSYEPWERN